MKTMNADTDVDIDPTVERVLRQRLTDLAGAAVVPPDGWEKLREQTEAGAVRSRWGRRRLIAAAAVLLVLVGSVVTDDPDRGKDRVSTDDSPSTTVDGPSEDDDRRTDADREDSDEVRTVDPDTDRSGARPGSRSPEDGRRASDSAAPAPWPAPGDDVSSGAGRGQGSPSPSPSPAPAPGPGPTTPGTTTTTTPPPPPRTPGDVTVTTSSGFSVEVLLTEREGYLGFADLRRTDSRYVGDFTSDGYMAMQSGTYTTWRYNSATDTWDRQIVGPTCIRSHQFVDQPPTDGHDFIWGVMGSGISAVSVDLTDGRTITPAVATRVVGEGVRAWLAEVPAPVERVEGTTPDGITIPVGSPSCDDTWVRDVEPPEM
jgi:hypothetical protein